MSSGNATMTRSPDDVGYVPWMTHRISALVLVGLLALHLGVQLYPGYGFVALRVWGVYGPMLDLTLGLVLLHGVLGVRSTVLGTALSPGVKTTLVRAVALVAVVLFGYRLFG
jgi:succinate dehydrogenase hydrophobic anchor subunit